MAQAELSDDTLRKSVAIAAQHASRSEAAFKLGISAGTLTRHLGLAKLRGLTTSSILVPNELNDRDTEHSIASEPTPYVPAQPKGGIERWILTSAQNDTPVHRQFFDNLRAYAAHVDARISVARFTYQTDISSERSRFEEKKGKREYTWASELAEFLTAERTPIGNLLFCAEMNTLPTAVRPLSGLHTYGQGKTCIFPHVKVALESVPISHGDFPPLVLTTGACTVPNYTDTKAGLKGAFHHVFAAVIVEVAEDGATFFRHLVANSEGSFQDLDVFVRGGKVTPGARVEAITFGDIQSPWLNAETALATWGFDVESWRRVGDGLVDILKPRFGFFHDLIDFKSISHHDEKKPKERFKAFVDGRHKVEGDITLGAQFLEQTKRDFMKSVVARSNHDRWLDRWLDRYDHRADLDNKLAFLTYEKARMEAIANGDDTFDVLHYALKAAPANLNDVLLLPEEGSFRICQDTGGIECGDHGDLGANGGPSGPAGLARVSGKATIGDKHSATIMDGLYVAGVSCELRLGFNKGPSSWRHAHVIAYGTTGKRTLLFIENGRWRA